MTASRYALVDSGGVVVNVMLYDPADPFTAPTGQTLLALPASSTVNAGDTVDAAGNPTARYVIPLTEANAVAIRAQAQTALNNLRAYIALASPTAAQNTAEIKLCSQVHISLIRLALSQFDGTG